MGGRQTWPTQLGGRAPPSPTRCSDPSLSVSMSYITNIAVQNVNKSSVYITDLTWSLISNSKLLWIYQPFFQPASNCQTTFATFYFPSILLIFLGHSPFLGIRLLFQLAQCFAVSTAVPHGSAPLHCLLLKPISPTPVPDESHIEKQKILERNGANKYMFYLEGADILCLLYNCLI